jgi:hypothetical protein
MALWTLLYRLMHRLRTCCYLHTSMEVETSHKKPPYSHPEVLVWQTSHQREDLATVMDNPEAPWDLACRYT